MKKRRISPGYTLVYLFLIIWSLTTIFPLGWSIMNSFKNKKMIYNNSFSFPLGNAFSLDNYRNIFENYNLFSAYRNSIIISGSVALVVIFLSGMAAYVLFVVQMENVLSLRGNRLTDPAFADALLMARDAGVGIYAVDCHVTPDSVVANEPLPVEFV